MNIIVRGLDPVVVRKIDELAAKKKISRNELLKKYVESFAIRGELREQEERYAQLIDKLAGVIERNTLAMKKIRGDEDE